MQRVARTVLVAHPAREMFDLVDQVEAYPEFLPWCAGTIVRQRDASVTRATIKIDYHHLRQSFTTCNSKQFPSRMDIRLEEGPFRNLQGHWRFIALDDGACKIEFELEYEFASKLLEKLVGRVFNYIANNLIDAFVRRADQIYAR